MRCVFGLHVIALLLCVFHTELAHALWPFTHAADNNIVSKETTPLQKASIRRRVNYSSTPTTALSVQRTWKENDEDTGGEANEVDEIVSTSDVLLDKTLAAVRGTLSVKDSKEAFDAARALLATYEERSMLMPCWKEALTTLNQSCRYIKSSKTLRSRLALSFAVCDENMDGRSGASFQCVATSDVQRCIRKMSERAYLIFLQYRLHTDVLCGFLEEELFQERSEVAVAALLAQSLSTSKFLQLLRLSVRGLSRAARESIEMQNTSLALSALMHSSLQNMSSSHARLSDVINLSASQVQNSSNMTTQTIAELRQAVQESTTNAVTSIYNLSNHVREQLASVENCMTNITSMLQRMDRIHAMLVTRHISYRTWVYAALWLLGIWIATASMRTAAARAPALICMSAGIFLPALLGYAQRACTSSSSRNSSSTYGLSTYATHMHIYSLTTLLDSSYFFGLQVIGHALGVLAWVPWLYVCSVVSWCIVAVAAQRYVAPEKPQKRMMEESVQSALVEMTNRMNALMESRVGNPCARECAMSPPIRVSQITTPDTQPCRWNGIAGTPTLNVHEIESQAERDATRRNSIDANPFYPLSFIRSKTSNDSRLTAHIDDTCARALPVSRVLCDTLSCVHKATSYAALPLSTHAVRVTTTQEASSSDVTGDVFALKGHTAALPLCCNEWTPAAEEIDKESEGDADVERLCLHNAMVSEPHIASPQRTRKRRASNVSLRGCNLSDTKEVEGCLQDTDVAGSNTPDVSLNTEVVNPMRKTGRTRSQSKAKPSKRRRR